MPNLINASGKDPILSLIDELKIQCPSKTLVFGPTGSGKTTMILNLLKNHYFAEEFSQIILCIPKMSIIQMEKTVQEYKSATNNLIQVRVESIVIRFVQEFRQFAIFLVFLIENMVCARIQATCHIFGISY